MGNTLLGVLAVLLLLPARALAVGRIELDRDVSLTVSYHDGGRGLVGVRFDLYRVADVSVSGDFTLSGDFAGCPVRLDGLDSSGWQAAAGTLAGYAAWQGALPLDSGLTDLWGRLTFPTSGGRLLPGLYLVVGERKTVGDYTYTPKPFLVCLPDREPGSQSWDYAVEAEPKFDREEPEKMVQRRVLKAWRDGDGQDRPQSVTVVLLRDGAVYDTVTLSASNGWRYAWEKLEGGHVWTVVELPVEGYTVSVTQEGVTFVVVNTRDEPDDQPPGPTPPEPTPPPDNPTPPDDTNVPDGPAPTDPALPQTGQLWWPVPVLLAAGLLLAVLGLLRRRGSGYEG